MNHEFRFLGAWELRTGAHTVEVPGVQLRILLTSLVLSANQTVGVDTLVARLWPERPPLRPRRSVHTYIGRLRQLLGPQVIRTQPGIGYQLKIGREAVDVHQFRDLLDRAARSTSVDKELSHLRAALTLWRGEPFPGLYSTWLERDVTPRLTEEWFAATGRRIELELPISAPEPLVAELWGLTERYPTRESLWALLISALHRAGRRADALNAYQRARRHLLEELGIEPSERLVELQRTILREGLDVPSVPVLRQLPHDIPRFTGRAEELAALDAVLANANGRTPVVITIGGAPGVGKTTLAVHWAQRVAERYRDAQLYLNLRGYGPGEPFSPESATERLLRAFGVEHPAIPSEMDARSALLRSLLATRPTLLVLDNARDAEQVRPLLPGSNGLVIVTSRSQLRGLSVRDGAHRVTLKPLSQQQSVQLLTAMVGERLVAAEPSAATALVELCDRLPLALATVAERALRADSLAHIVAELADEQARLDSLDTWEDTASTSLRAALSWSYQALSAEVAAMFRTLGLHPAGDIEVRTAAALAGVPVGRARMLLDQLVGVHLAEQRHPNRYELHDLVRLYAAELAGQDDPGERQAAMIRVLDWYLHAAVSADTALLPHRNRGFIDPYRPSQPPPDFDSARQAGDWFEQEWDCLRSVTIWAARNGFTGHAWRIAHSMTTFFHQRLPWKDGVDFYSPLVFEVEDTGDLVGAGYLHIALATVNLDVGALDSVLAHSKKSIEYFQAAAHRLGEAIATGNLAMTYGKLGDSAQARHYAEAALRLYEHLDHPRGVAFNLDNLGLAHLAAGEYDKAVTCHRLSIAITAGDHDVEAWGQLHLAQAYAGLRDYPRSTRAFRRALALHRTLGNRRWEGIVLVDLGTMLIDAGHPVIARSLWRRAVPILTEYSDPRAEDLRGRLASA